MAVVVVTVLMSSCSSEEPARSRERQEDYCAKLGSWQDARRAVADAGADDARSAPSSESDDVASAGQAAISASRRLGGDGIAADGSDVLDATVAAVAGDTDAEGRAVSYCDDSGFETLVDSAG
ncbi:hypothetical protein [Streptomyces sp. NPDC003697]